MYIHCNTNFMNTTFSLRLDKELKDNFLEATKQKWLDGSVLLRYFMQSFTQQQDIVEFSIEEAFFDDMFKDKTIVSKLSRVSGKLDELWF